MSRDRQYPRRVYWRRTPYLAHCAVARVLDGLIAYGCSSILCVAPPEVATDLRVPPLWWRSELRDLAEIEEFANRR